MDSRRTPRTQRPISWRSSAGPLAIAVCLFVFAAAMTDSDHFDPTDGHSSLACSSCHVLTASTERTYYPTTDLSGQCRACHNTMQAAPDELALSFHGAKDADCVRCHSFHETSRISLNSVELRFDFSNQVRSAQCFSCHGEGTRHGRTFIGPPGSRRVVSFGSVWRPDGVTKLSGVSF